MSIKKIGILGAGRAGTALARAAASSGIDVNIAGSRPPRMMKYHLAQYAPKAVAVSAEDVANDVELVVLMVPQEELDEVDPDIPSGSLLVDATNRWQDEPLPQWFEDSLSRGLSSSEAVAERFAQARLVKALNHISHWDLDADSVAKATSQRALGTASNNAQDAKVVASLIEQLGFFPVILSSLAEGKHLEPGGEIFNEVLGVDELTRRLTGKISR
ncbi:NADPH-dependent F420 reductase [Glutamicibacter sp. M10]|uniref:NADPH-dependent F420 reductase n=1 Tax=Glutamicibacter sp. M10 TaxID=3023076 RepID=UPI0021C874D0|nr:NAD(P)-binding domain-containing protein [Glutamicibacter sp. M10]UXN31129.1 NAD(P)-binding domain-containing protein [Glutamicibacter sp. M10]